MDNDAVVNQIMQDADHARFLANSAVSATNTLVSNAIGTINQYQPDFPSSIVSPVEVGLSVGNIEFTATQKPAEFPTIRTAQTITLDGLGDIDTLDETFTEEAPTLDLPAYSYSAIEKLGAFNGVRPEIDTTFDLPDKPDITSPEKPTLLEINTDLHAENITLPDTDVALPSAPTYQLTDTFADQFSVGRTQVPNPDEYGMELLNRFYPNFMELWLALSSRLQGILDGTQTALTDLQDDHLYSLMQSKVNETANAAKDELTASIKSVGWEMPGLISAAGRKRIDSFVQSELNKAALAVHDQRRQSELQHLQFVMGLAAGVNQSALSVFSAAVGFSFQGFQSALQYGQLGEQFAIAVYQALQGDYDRNLALVDKKIAIIRIKQEGELARLEVVKANLQVEQLKEEVNKGLQQQYRDEIASGQQQLDLYEKEISALVASLQGRRLPLEAFKSDIEGYLASYQAKEGEYRQLASMIQADDAKTRGQLGRLDIYKTKASIFDTRVSAKAKKIDGQIARNRQSLDKFKIQQDAEVQLSQIDAAVAEHALKAYQATSAVFLAENEAELKAAEMDFNQTYRNSELELREDQFAFDKEVKKLELEMTRIRALAEMQLSGARVQSGIATGYASAINTLNSLSASVTS